jgi:tetratricopeptide (TPR) repeat protein
MPIPFAVLLGLAVVGIRARPFSAEAWLMLIFVLVNLASAMIFYFSSRYRLPAIPFLCVFAGAGASLLVARWQANESMLRWMRFAAPGAGVFLLSAIPWFPDYELQAANQYFNMGNEYFYADEYESAVSYYRTALEKLDGKAKIHNNLGVTFKVLGRWPEAVLEFERTLELDPTDEIAAQHLQESRHKAALMMPKRDSEGTESR